MIEDSNEDTKMKQIWKPGLFLHFGYIFKEWSDFKKNLLLDDRISYEDNKPL